MSVYGVRSVLHLLNARYRCARVKTYIEQGYYQMQTPIRLTIAGTVLDYWARRIGLPVPAWFILVSILVCLPVFYGIGVLWTRYGFQQQEGEVQLLEGMSWGARVNAVQQYRIMAALDTLLRILGSPQRCEYNHIPSTLPAACVEILASARKTDA